MSFDLFVQGFQNGQPSEFSAASIEKGFGPFAESREPSCWVLRYPDGGVCELYIRSEQLAVSHFMIARPQAIPCFGKCFSKFCNKRRVVSIGPAADRSSPSSLFEITCPPT